MIAVTECTKTGCTRIATDGFRRCVACRLTVTNSKKKLTARLKAEGICIQCYIAPATHGRTRCEQCAEAQARQARQRINALRRRVVENYGGECPCGESRYFALDLHHVDGGGSIERRRQSAFTTLNRIIEQGYPDTFRLLCGTCHNIESRSVLENE